MYRTTCTALLLFICAGPASAQRMGSINRTAPTIEQKINLGATGTVGLTYAGIKWGSGQWAAALKNEQMKGRMRQRINRTAEENPLGSFTCTKDINVGDVRVPAGKYKMAFQLDDAFAWEVVLRGDGDPVKLPLKLLKAEEESKRLVIGLYAGDEDFTGGLYLAFGTKFITLTITPAATTQEG